MQSPSVRILQVQILRAVAALAVVIYHAQYDAQTLADRLGLIYRRSELLPWAAGVDIFFVVSGFIMVYSSGKLFANLDGPRIFLVRRIVRIVPLYWLLSTLYLMVGYLRPEALNRGGPSLAAIIASYLFIPFARPDGTVHPVYAIGWTLNYEMFFYVVFAAAIRLPRLKAIAVVSAVLVGLVLLASFLQPLPVPLAFWGEPIVLEFVFGMVLGLLFAEGQSLDRGGRLALVGTALALLHVDLVRSEAAVVLPRVLAYGAPATMLVAAAVLIPRNALPCGAAGRVAARLGDASYALYLVHPFAIRGLREIFAHAGPLAAVSPVIFVPLAVALSLALALLLFHFGERPLTRAARKWCEV